MFGVFENVWSQDKFQRIFFMKNMKTYVDKVTMYSYVTGSKIISTFNGINYSILFIEEYLTLKQLNILHRIYSHGLVCM